MFSALTSDIKKVCGGRHRTVYEHIWNTSWEFVWKHQHLLTPIPELVESYDITRHVLLSVSHRKVADAAGVLQQLLKWDSPAQHTVGWGDVSAGSPWKTGAAASTATSRHVQLYKHIQTQTHPFISTEKHDQERGWIRYFLLSCTDTFQFGGLRDVEDCRSTCWLFMLTSVWHCLALWIERQRGKAGNDNKLKHLIKWKTPR